jgi:hypothetical protein
LQNFNTFNSFGHCEPNPSPIAMVVIGMDNQCPWGRDHIDLRKVVLTAEQKYWLGTQIFTNTLTVAQLVYRYQLGGKVLYKYSSSVAKGTILHGGRGRPFKVTPEQSWFIGPFG